MEVGAYLLCAGIAFACCVLLLRGYFGSKVRLLLWCGLCFAALSAENVFLFIDRMIGPEIDLSYLHVSAALIGVLLLLYGLIWDGK